MVASASVTAGSHDRITAYETRVATEPRLAAVRDALRDYENRLTPLHQSLRDVLSQFKVEAVAKGDDVAAGAAWCLETVADAQDRYLEACRSMRDDLFHGAWCSLEQAEIALLFLARHFTDQNNEYGVHFLEGHIPRWQKLFPYRHFLSPGFVQQAIHCSVCDHRLTPRNQCEHRVGDLHNGEMVHRVGKQVRMLEISIVTNPVQKYSVAFMPGHKYNYAAVHYVERAMPSPWYKWDVQVTSRQREDARFQNVPRNAPCPCGSGKKFKKCDEHTTHYETPHFSIEFLDDPSPGVIPGESDVPYYGRDGNVGGDPE
jgi:hypothetical protein